MIEALLGRRCASIRQFRHEHTGERAGDSGPIEFAWDDGTWLTLDSGADWTLDVSSRPWVDPYAHASESELDELVREVGIWREVPVRGPLCQLVGQAVTSVEAELNEVGELTGLGLGFEAQAIAARVLRGELVVEVLE